MVARFFSSSVEGTIKASIPRSNRVVDLRVEPLSVYLPNLWTTTSVNRSIAVLPNRQQLQSLASAGSRLLLQRPLRIGPRFFRLLELDHGLKDVPSTNRRGLDELIVRPTIYAECLPRRGVDCGSRATFARGSTTRLQMHANYTSTDCHLTR